MKYAFVAALALVALVAWAPAVLAEEVDAAGLRNQIDGALQAPTAERLERREADSPWSSEVTLVGGRRKADGTCCPPPPPPVLREDPCTPIDPCEPPDCCASPFSVTLALGFSLAQGNTDKLDFTFAGEARYDARPWLVRLRWLFAYGEEDGSAATDAQHSDLRLERRFGRKWSAFAALSFDSDTFADLQYRWIGNVGAGYWFFEYKGTFLKGEVGVGHTTEKRRGLVETNSISGYAGAEYLRKFRNGVDFSARGQYFPNFDNHDLSLFVFAATLAIPLNETFAFALTTRIDHVIDAPGMIDNTDIILAIAIQAGF